MGRAANQLLLGVGGADIVVGGFTPLDLFNGTSGSSSGSEKGFWIDYNDTSTLWQESGSETTQADAASDPIGTVNDKSGNNLDFTARADTSVRPTFVSGGGAQFTSGNSTLHEHAATADYISADSTLSCFAVASVPGTDAGRIVSAYDVSAASNDYGGATASYAILNAGGSNNMRSYVFSTNLSVTYTSDTISLFEAWQDATTRSLLVDGGTADTVSTETAKTLDNFGIGAIPNGSVESPTSAIIYEVILIDRVLDATELSDLRNYLNTKWSI